jgi:hypothetical protein
VVAHDRISSSEPHKNSKNKWEQFNLQIAKGNIITCFKGIMQNKISRRIVMVPIEVQKSKFNN